VQQQGSKWCHQTLPPPPAHPSQPQPTHWPHLSHILTRISKAHVSACHTRMKQSISLARTLHPELTPCTHQLRDDPRRSYQRQERHASDEVARRRDRPRDARSGWQVSFDKNMSTGSIGKSTRGLRTDRRHLLSRATHPRHLPVRVPFQALLSSAVAIGVLFKRAFAFCVSFQACRHLLRAISSTPFCYMCSRATIANPSFL
jgi:hypothetical protein